AAVRAAGGHLAAADPEVELVPETGTWREPAGLGGRFGPGREDPGGRHRVAPLEGEGGVRDVVVHVLTALLAVVGVLAVCAVAGEVVAEPVEPGFPGGALSRDPGLRRPERVRLDAAGPHPAGLLGPDQAAGLEYLQVLQHRGQRHVQRPG